MIRVPDLFGRWLPASRRLSRDDRLDTAYIVLILLLGASLAGVAVQVAGPARSDVAERRGVTSAEDSALPQAADWDLFPSPGTGTWSPSPAETAPARIGPLPTASSSASGASPNEPRTTVTSSAVPRTTATRPATGSTSPGPAVGVPAPREPICTYLYDTHLDGAGIVGGGEFDATLVVTNVSSSDWDGWRGVLDWEPVPTILVSSGDAVVTGPPFTDLVPSRFRAYVPAGRSIIVRLQGRGAAAPARVSAVAVRGQECRRLGAA